MAYKVYNFTIASAATGTNKQFVGAHDRAFIVTSGMVSWAAGTTNEVITVRGGLSATDTHGTVQSCTITTYTAGKGVYPMPYPGLQYMSLGLTSASTSSGSIDVVVYSFEGDN